ncbi:ABC transporter permease [Paraburkholderia caledonica]|uniref:Spermidine/putrescine transport system permease protein n=1 Tax=Paraburkholderia caledonica TaxID=134536 RepID=A0AB73ILX7_9BURK|nr:putative spermidine/putrescine transport system permease protein [Paraburkholderia caledonica]
MPKGSNEMKRNGLIASIYHLFFVAFILAPIITVIWISFTPDAYLSIPTTRWSFRWFAEISNHAEFINSFKRSLFLGLASATVSLSICVPAALAIAKSEFWGRSPIAALFMSPLMIPNFVLGIAYLRFFTLVGAMGSFASLVVAHTVVVFPYALRLILSTAARGDPSLGNAAVSLGASRWTVLVRVTLPLIMPGVVSGWILSFINSFDEVSMTLFVATTGMETLPVRMLNYIQDNTDPLVASVSTCMIVLTVGLVFVIDRTFGLERLLVGQASSRSG